jgi:predicted ATP-grasp superfamily ATP-dependent carboligase
VAVPCFVLGLFDTGLAAVRQLSRAGVPVVAFDYQQHEPGFRSRFGKHVVCPHSTAASNLIDCLITHARATGTRPILFPTSDPFVAFVSQYREVLGPYLQHALPSAESVAAALDKRAQYKVAAAAGVPSPMFHTPCTIDEVRRLAGELEYPVVVKPAVGHRWRQEFRQDKALRVDDADALTGLFEEILAAGQWALVQSLVEGPNTNHVKVCAYYDSASNPIAVMCMRKIRQYPVDFGVGTLMESVTVPEVQELGLRLFAALRWRGPGSIEFKRDDRDGQWKLIELNPRLWQQHALAAACGLSFPLIQYFDLTGQRQHLNGCPTRVRWIDEFRDPRSAWEHRRRGSLTVGGWLRSLAGVRQLALWAADDPAPFLASLRHHARLAWRKVVSATRHVLAG